jgi:Vitamin K-dependent gamma-carboxylase
LILKRFLKIWDSIWFVPVSPSPICLLRILYGIVCIVNGLLYGPDFLTWFGEHGVLPAASVRHFGPRPSILLYFDFTDSEVMAVLWSYVLFACLVTIGLWTRLSTFMTWMLGLTFIARQPLMFHQVDSVLRLMGFVLCLSPAGAMYSIDHWLSRKKKGTSSEPQLYSPWAQRLIQFQVVCLYFKAFWGKLLGETWRQGTAVYYATHYTTRHHLPHFMDNLLFYKFMTYYTLVIEFSMWSLIWIQPLTKWILLGATILHLGIDWCINLDLLEWSAMIMYVLFLKPAEVERFMTLVGNLFLRRQKPAAS